MVEELKIHNILDLNPPSSLTIFHFSIYYHLEFISNFTKPKITINFKMFVFSYSRRKY